MARKLPRVGSPVLGSALIVSVSLLAGAPPAGAGTATAGAPQSARTGAAPACASSGGEASSRVGRLLGMAAPQVTRSGACAGTSTTGPAGTPLTPNARTLPSTAATTPTPSNPGATFNAAKGFSGTPPLLYHGGPIMGTKAIAGEVTVVSVYWDPTSSMSAGYKNVINGYVTNVAADDGKLANVYSADRQYGAAYDVHAGTPVTATDAITNGCTPDSGAVYSDNSGYSKCVTDAQIQTELNKVLSTHGLPSDLSHSYTVMLPKGVESCEDGRNNAQRGVCTISNGGGTFCAYHSSTFGNAIYSDIPFPIYNSPAGFTCGSDAALGINESPNGQLDADVVLSSISHELNESITDPLGSAWFDSHGNENADDCAEFYGPLSGFAGAAYNQTINGAHYLTQEEFSNEDYRVSKNSACIQRVDLPIASFKVQPRSPKAHHSVRFNAAKSKGSIVSFAWTFGDVSVPGSGRRTSHLYGAPGTYTVTLKVTDSVGHSNTTTVVVAVG